MPRHRRVRVPKHRARRLAGYPARRARLTAAVPAPGTGLDGVGLVGSGLDVAGLDVIGLAGTGLDRLDRTEPDDAKTAPLAAFTGTPPRSFDSEVAGAAGLAGTDAGARSDGATHNGAADRSTPALRPPAHSRQRSRRVSRAAASRLASKQPGFVRGLLVTPWFAAATGFVIAASLWIYSPHPQLIYPAIAIGKVPCNQNSCAPSIEGQGSRQLTVNSGEPPTRLPNSAKPAGTGTRAQTRTAASGLTFGYVVLPPAHGDFAVTVSVTGKRPIKNWHLAFVLPGDHIQGVIGAHWQAAGSDGGTASAFTGDPGQQGGGAWGPGGGYGNRSDGGTAANEGGSADGYGGAPAEYRISFTVIGSGTNAVPTDCRYDGAACTFHQMSGHY